MFDQVTERQENGTDVYNLIASARIMIGWIEQHHDEPAREHATVMLHALQKVVGLTEGDAEWPEMGSSLKVHGSRDLYDLTRMAIFSACSEQDGSPRAPNFSITVDPDVSVHIDGLPLLRVLINLIETAVGGTVSEWSTKVSVHVQQDRDQVLFRISDDGPGLSYWAQAALRLGAKTEHNPHRKMGSGLLTASHLARVMGGTIDLQETGTYGTVLHFRVPKVPSKVERKPADVADVESELCQSG
ncbi:sensor histidine kinase KdpD [uncultured Tateyamaria sp.]|uniref:sensor histidine kinase n=1 Tax=uncultured Tateyamaria sp. TaxID=455651 RepID=UPI002635CE8B|nr:HAMP domain-containing sensor histidine kinase [uncultured Tateyamaria sp.]